MSAASPPKVDLVVGIDFGMTFTGTAFSNLKMPTPRVVQNWPGKAGETHNKSPTTILYSAEAPDEVEKWGFQSQFSEGNKHWFKRMLDPGVLQSLKETARKANIDRSLPELKEVRRWYKDYMTCLYNHLSDTIQNKNGRWASKRVDFIFSLPSTFGLGSIGDDLLDILRKAGFGKGGAHHSISFGLTESEAAGVYTIKETAVDIEKGQVMLVCDAGGGTTDVAVLEIIGENNGIPELKELNVIEGRDIGSTNIDKAFGQMVDMRLDKVDPKLDSGTAWTMMHSAEYLGWKLSFGQEDSNLLDTFTISVPKVDSTFDCADASIHKGQMHFSKRDFRSFFDPEINRIIDLIGQELQVLARNHPKKKAAFIVLSGGLGSSAYLRSRLESFFLDSRFPGLSRKAQILVSEEPQLAVVKGLVIDRIQKLKSGRAVLNGRLSRASYGFDIARRYDKKKHVGSPIKVDFDGEILATGQVEWMIKKGDMVDVEHPLIHELICQFSPEGHRQFFTEVYTSDVMAEDLPETSNHADVKRLCTIRADLSHVPLESFDKGWSPSKIPGMRGPLYYEASYKLKAIIGAGDIRFEMWFRDNQYMDKNRIKVAWDKS